jgi:hypothetical protein
LELDKSVRRGCGAASAGMRLISFHVTALEFARLARLTCVAFNIRLATRMICDGHWQR